jgi:hypothetical protein
MFSWVADTEVSAEVDQCGTAMKNRRSISSFSQRFAAMAVADDDSSSRLG